MVIHPPLICQAFLALDCERSEQAGKCVWSSHAIVADTSGSPMVPPCLPHGCGSLHSWFFWPCIALPTRPHRRPQPCKMRLGLLRRSGQTNPQRPQDDLHRMSFKAKVNLWVDLWAGLTWSSIVIYGHLWSSTVIYGHLWCSVLVCPSPLAFRCSRDIWEANLQRFGLPKSFSCVREALSIILLQPKKNWSPPSMNNHRWFVHFLIYNHFLVNTVMFSKPPRNNRYQ